MTAKRSHKRKKWSTKRRLLDHRPTRPSRLATPMQEPIMYTEPPMVCDKCGCKYIGIDVEIMNTVRMARCLGSLGGCGKTWRLINNPVDCYAEGTNGDSSDEQNT